ncbi:TPA: hypothetical protein N2O39_002481 [Escherichia coli]|uniref:hypothetical protein n=1 Tax=Escherichia coli TaxID=562 RepID=UPI000DD5BA84|nr:hypothetical protein [Escherichia coli]UXI73924.1 hypothetical protein N5922_00340 [Escherichia coli]HCL6011126.1 hypothetical protein [Escherichia coli]
MSNSFDFELVADDRASAAIDDINEAIRNLGPHLEKTRGSLRLGGLPPSPYKNGSFLRLL